MVEKGSDAIILSRLATSLKHAGHQVVTKPEMAKAEVVAVVEAAEVVAVVAVVMRNHFPVLMDW